MSIRELQYEQVDVFAERALEGNQLGIFPDARGLSDAEMQALARETNFAETTFVLPREESVEREKGVRVRIFTTEEELPFAGHPTLGTASWLYWHHRSLRGQESIVLDLNAGRVPVRFSPAVDGKPGIYGTMQQKDLVFGAVHDPAAVAPLLGLAQEDLDGAKPIQTVSTGLPFCIVPLRSAGASARLQSFRQQAEAYLAGTDAKFFFCLAPGSAGSGADWHNRMQFGSGEDPATGSASGCAIAYLVQHGYAASGQTIVFEQGVEMRASQAEFSFRRKFKMGVCGTCR